jgi:hypothetical protein
MGSSIVCEKNFTCQREAHVDASADQTAFLTLK